MRHFSDFCLNKIETLSCDALYSRVLLSLIVHLMYQRNPCSESSSVTFSDLSDLLSNLFSVKTTLFKIGLLIHLQYFICGGLALFLGSSHLYMGSLKVRITAARAAHTTQEASVTENVTLIESDTAWIAWKKELGWTLQSNLQRLWQLHAILSSLISTSCIWYGNMMCRRESAEPSLDVGWQWDHLNYWAGWMNLLGDPALRVENCSTYDFPQMVLQCIIPDLIPGCFEHFFHVMTCATLVVRWWERFKPEAAWYCCHWLNCFSCAGWV